LKVASVASLPHILPTAFVHVPTVHVRVSRVCLLVTVHQRPVGRFCNDLSRYDWWRPARRARGQALRLYTVYRHDTAGGIASMGSEWSHCCTAISRIGLRHPGVERLERRLHRDAVANSHTAIHSHSQVTQRRRGLQLSTHRVLPNSARLPPPCVDT
jgi:hypothetical protein